MLKGLFHPGKNCSPERVVLVDHRYFPLMQIVPKVIDLLFSFVKIRGPHTYDVRFERLVQQLSTRKQPPNRHFVRLGLRPIFARCRGAYEKSSRKHFLVDQTIETVNRFPWLITIVQAEKLYLASVHPTFVIDIVEICFGAGDGLATQDTSRP